MIGKKKVYVLVNFRQATKISPGYLVVIIFNTQQYWK